MKFWDVWMPHGFITPVSNHHKLCVHKGDFGYAQMGIDSLWQAASLVLQIHDNKVTNEDNSP